MFVPTDFTRIVPYIFVANAASYVDYLKDGLGFTELGRSEAPDGSVGNCQLRLADSVMMISEAGANFQPSQSAFYIYCENADESQARAVAAGGEVVMDVADMPYGDRQGGVRDPAGNIWWISQRLVKEGYF